METPIIEYIKLRFFFFKLGLGAICGRVGEFAGDSGMGADSCVLKFDAGGLISCRWRI